jgi:hypothetical protein
LGCSGEALRRWVRQAERDAGRRPGRTTDERARLTQREGLRAARCRVRRLMREMGLVGAARGRAWTTTTQSSSEANPPNDLVDRRFTATRPNQLWVADLTYVATWRGFVYVAFVTDLFARRIVGWRVSSALARDFVLDALEQAIYDRCGPTMTGLVHHSDRGKQYLSMRYTTPLADAGIAPPVGSRSVWSEARSAAASSSCACASVAARARPRREALGFDLVDVPTAALNEVMVSGHDFGGFVVGHRLLHHGEEFVEVVHLDLTHHRPVRLAAHVGEYTKRPVAQLLPQAGQALEPAHHIPDFSGLAVHHIADHVHG